jgi:hypothetical protein
MDNSALQEGHNLLNRGQGMFIWETSVGDEETEGIGKGRKNMEGLVFIVT